MNILSSSPFASRPERTARWLIFSGVFVIALVFAALTRHAWEDYYITYRCSKNLATGHGLVYTAGERVHAFTSPLNVLVPALLSVMTGNRSDELVLWLFRVVSGGLLAGAAVLLYDLARRNALSRTAAVVLVGLFGLDAKIVDFSINGQEIGFMMFFLALALHALTVRSGWTVLKLGLAGAGLMWTRPDGFIYLGALGAGFLIFDAGRSVGRTRLGLLKVFLYGGLLTAVLYLPWLLWAWHYYGSPVPHTIIAKSVVRDAAAGPHRPLLLAVLYSPIRMLRTSAGATFLPAYALVFGGWHWTTAFYGKALACVCVFYWCLPFVRPQARAVSFAFMLGHFYLSCAASFPFPWYLPNCAILGIFVLAHIVQQGVDVAASFAGGSDQLRRRLRTAVCCLAAMILSAAFLLLLCAAWQLRIQQREIEEGSRKQIGLWLKQQAASPADTVFLEPLGYIGFFSQLKMLDTPGLCAPEVVAVEKRLKTTNLGKVVPELKPDWLVLRPAEARQITDVAPPFLTEDYSTAKVFDASQRIASYGWLPGRGYLDFDKAFTVFKRNEPRR